MIPEAPLSIRPAPKRDAGIAAGPAITPAIYARMLLQSLALGAMPLPAEDNRDADSLWASSGAMWLTGHPERECRHSPAPIAACAQGAWLALATLAPRHFDLNFEAHRLLGERAACAGLERRGRVSAGGACRLLQARDGWLALNLPRESDWGLIPAWLQRSAEDHEALTGAVRERAIGDLVSRARLLGLAAAPMRPPSRARHSWYQASRVAPRAPRPDIHRVPLVIDLGALWAAPLCAQLLRQAGARVIKVESHSRPDGARAGPRSFFDLLNFGKESVALELQTTGGRDSLRRLLQCADIVIESSRPRALEQMGIFAADVVAATPGLVWIGLSGYGRRLPNRHWIAYGDDAGVAAGLSWLVGDAGRDPVFCGDAIADPVSGLHAALLAMADWRNGGGRILDISLGGVVQYIASLRCTATQSTAHPVAQRPFARFSDTRASPLGADTTNVLREFARRSA